MKIKWWHWVLLGLGCSMIIGGVIWWSTPLWQDKPSLDRDEVVSIVERDLIARGRLSTIEDSVAWYLGKGLWWGYSTGYTTESQHWIVEWAFNEKTKSVSISITREAKPTLMRESGEAQPTSGTEGGLNIQETQKGKKKSLLERLGIR